MERVVRAADHEHVVSDRRERGARLNAVRSLVGLAPITPDTTAPMGSYSPYCRLLQHAAGWLLPADAPAQQPRPPAPPPRRAAQDRPPPPPPPGSPAPPPAYAATIPPLAEYPPNRPALTPPVR